MLMYGSIFIDVTGMSQLFSNVPIELDIIPFPTPLMTPPVTKTYFILCCCFKLLTNRTRGEIRLHIMCYYKKSMYVCKNTSVRLFLVTQTSLLKGESFHDYVIDFLFLYFEYLFVTHHKWF